jgi:hypothetical protein
MCCKHRRFYLVALEMSGWSRECFLSLGAKFVSISLLPKKCKDYDIQIYNFVSCFVWVWNFVSEEDVWD